MWNHIYLMFKTYCLYHGNAHFILEGVVTTFQLYIIIVFFMTTMVNMLTKSENKKSKKIVTTCPGSNKERNVHLEMRNLKQTELDRLKNRGKKG